MVSDGHDGSAAATRQGKAGRECQTSVWITSSSLPCVTPPTPPAEAPIMALPAFPKLKAMAAASVAALGGRISPSHVGLCHWRVGEVAARAQGGVSAAGADHEVAAQKKSQV